MGNQWLNGAPLMENPSLGSTRRAVGVHAQELMCAVGSSLCGYRPSLETEIYLKLIFGYSQI